MRKILFVCAGNTCRSPMAEIILKSKLKEKGIQDILVESAGEFANDGSPINPNSVYALTQLGYTDFNGFASKKSTFEVKNDCSIIIYMEQAWAKLNAHWGALSMADFSECGDIIDPYGKDKEEYLKTARQIEKACQNIIEKIVKGELFI